MQKVYTQQEAKFPGPHQPLGITDLTGRVFGRLTVIEYAGKYSWLTRCDCGNLAVAAASNLEGGSTRSCGCLRRELIGNRTATHGMSNTPEYQMYMGQRRRCQNPNDRAFSDYGSRGIEFRFNSFQEWYAELGPRPGPEYSVDRIDNDGHYECGNVRWATATEQNRNRRDTRIYEYDGKRQPLRAWAEEYGIKFATLYKRVVTRGMSFSDALTVSLRVGELIEFKGESKDLATWAADYGVDYGIVWMRVYKYGWCLEDALLANPNDTGKHELNGQKKTIREWAQEYGIHYTTVFKRIKRGLTLEQALNAPSAKARITLYEFNGEKKPLSEWAKKYGLEYDIVYKRVARGMPFERALGIRPE